MPFWKKQVNKAKKNYFSEADWKDLMKEPNNGVISVKRDGKKVTVENDHYVGYKCGELKKMLEAAFPPK